MLILKLHPLDSPLVRPSIVEGSLGAKTKSKRQEDGRESKEGLQARFLEIKYNEFFCQLVNLLTRMINP